MSSSKSSHCREPFGKKNRNDSKRKREYSSSSSNSDSDEWVEKVLPQKHAPREDWMSMTGMLKTYTKNDIKPKSDPKEKKNIDSYNPGSSTRELNPYWKNGGSGLPQTSDEMRKSKKFLKPSEDEDYYQTKHRSSDYDRKHRENESHRHRSHKDAYERRSHTSSSNWRKDSRDKDRSHKGYQTSEQSNRHDELPSSSSIEQINPSPPRKEETQPKESKYLSNEKMNKLAAKMVKAEIMGNTKLVNELKAKLDAAREYNRQNPDAGKTEEEDEGVLLMSTNSMGNSRPLTKSSQYGDPRSKSGKKKSDTHQSGERTKYFSNDDKYNLADLFQKEKYGNGYDDDAEFAKIATKHKNPNDDLEDIFTDEISKNKSAGKEDMNERERAIRQHVKMQKSMDGCEYCLDSKKMLKHMMVSCGEKVYMALPCQKSLVDGHCIISTIHHVPCVTALDEDVWEEIMDFRKALTKYFNSMNEDIIFFETATKLHKFPHLVIHCIPMPRDVGDTAPIYFKKALLECEGEWAMNKKVVDLKGRNIRKGIPKGLPYFWVDFGMDPGFAHVIEDQQLFPKSFAQEIIGGILDLDHSLWKNPKKDHGDNQRKKVLKFVEKWRPYDTVSKK